MPQQPRKERRREPRHDMSVPVWWRSPGQVSGGRGWMLDISGHGAAMLAPRETCPVVGDHVNVSLVDPLAGRQKGVSQYLLKRATVHRVDPVGGSLGRVALHFDEVLWNQDAPPALNTLRGLFSDDPVR